MPASRPRWRSPSIAPKAARSLKQMAAVGDRASSTAWMPWSPISRVPEPGKRRPDRADAVPRQRLAIAAIAVPARSRCWSEPQIMAMRRWPRDARCPTASRVPWHRPRRRNRGPCRRWSGTTEPAECGRRQMREVFGRAAAGGAQDHAVGPILLQRAQHALLPLEILAIGAEQDRAAHRRGGLLDRRQQFGEIRVGDVVEADARGCWCAPVRRLAALRL